MRIIEIGKVHNEIKQTMDPTKFKEVTSLIKIKNKFLDGLYRLEESKYVTVAFLLHKSKDPVKLKQTTRHGEYKGVFACRSPQRPSALGISTVKLLEKNDVGIRVLGLDAINGTPVLDIKPYAPIFDDDLSDRTENLEKSLVESIDPDAPRRHIIDLIIADRKKSLLLQAGQLHGHYCPGLALGIHLAVAAIQEIRKFTDGIMENLLAVVDMNNCASDGVQFVTGCTFANNALIFDDVGKTALVLACRDGPAVRVSVKENWRENSGVNPEYTKLFEKVVKDRNATDEEVVTFRKLSKQTSFEMMKIPAENIVQIEKVTFDPPPRAPIHPSFKCASCGEITMGSRKSHLNDEEVCLKCGDEGFYRLTGHGIELKK